MGGYYFEDMVKNVMSNEAKIGGNHMISYYDLLTMIKRGNKPPIIKYKDCSGTHIYKFDKEQGYYISKGNHHYIVLDMKLMKMFEKNIEIIKSKKMERLKIENDEK